MRHLGINVLLYPSRYIIIFFILIYTLSGCATRRRCAEKFPGVAKTDSIHVEKLDTVKIEIPGDSLIIETVVPCDNFELLTENGKLKQQLKVVNGKLMQMINIKPDTVEVYKTNTITRTNILKVPERIKWTPKFWLITGSIGIGFIVGLIVWVILKLKP